MADEPPIDAGERVCPSCGSPAGSQAFCAACGLNLTAVPRLPSRAEWEAQQAPHEEISADESADPGSSPRRSPGIAWRRPRPWMVGAAAAAVVAIVIVVIATSGGGSLSLTHVQVTLQDHYPTQSEGYPLRWECNQGPESGDTCAAEVKVNGVTANPEPIYKLHPNGGGCFTLSDERPPVAQEKGLPQNISQCY